MAEVIKGIDTAGGLKRYSPKWDTFENTLDVVADGREQELNSENADKFQFIGTDNADEEFILNEFSEPCRIKLPFLGFLGSVGKLGENQGYFPFYSAYPNIPEGLTAQEKEDCFGPNWHRDPEDDLDSYFQIGEDYPPRRAVCDHRIYAQEISSKETVKFPRLIGLRSDEVYTHINSSDVAILITEKEVRIYKPSTKRNIELHLCGEDFKRQMVEENAKEGEVRTVDRTQTCIIEAMTQASGYQVSDFAYLMERKLFKQKDETYYDYERGKNILEEESIDDLIDWDDLVKDVKRFEKNSTFDICGPQTQIGIRG